MLQAIIDKDTSEIIIRGEFFELDKIYFLIERLSGNYGNPEKHYLPDYENAANLLLGLTHEIRKAETGDRELYVSYNGIRDYWIAPTGTPDSQIVKFEEEKKEMARFDPFDDIILFDLDMDPDEFYDLPEGKQQDLLDEGAPGLDPDEIDAYLAWLHRKHTYYFHEEDYPGASSVNTRLQFRIPFREGILYAFVLKTLLSMKDEIMETAIKSARKEDAALREYELDFCTLRLPKELALLEVLTEHLFSCIAEMCGREKYLAIRKKEAPKDFFRKISNAKIETISEMLKTAGGDASTDLEQMIEMIY